MKVWLHIGMPRTGTTALQSFLWRNRVELQAAGFFYPDLGMRQHLPLVRCLAQQSGATTKFPRGGHLLDAQHLDELLSPSGHAPPNVLISSENFYQRAASVPGAMRASFEAELAILGKIAIRTREFLSGLDATVLIWVRRQDYWLESIFRETVRTSGFCRPLKDFSMQTLGADIHGIVSQWIAAFGREHVHCRAYDALRASSRGIVADFGEAVGIPLGDRSWEAAEGEMNSSLSSAAIRLKLCINEVAGRNLGPEELPPILERASSTLQRSSASGPPLMTTELRGIIKERFSAGNTALVNDLHYHDLEPYLSWDAGSFTDEASTGSVMDHDYQDVIKALVSEIFSGEQTNSAN